jgi:hypothetical protein
MAEKTVRLIIDLKESEALLVDDYWHEHRLKSRTAAIRAILKNFLDSRGAYALLSVRSEEELVSATTMLKVCRGEFKAEPIAGVADYRIAESSSRAPGEHAHSAPHGSRQTEADPSQEWI